MSLITVDCLSLPANPAQQQATIEKNITSWKEHDNDVVQVNWVPTKSPIPGVNPGSLDISNAQIRNQPIGTN
ncbi:MAG TPA: hypothetical protein VJS43_17275 [Candidatus Acidoferrales bacterium]|nr:hypothetical protein [Candidatus Acidoferrales bacterium]